LRGEARQKMQGGEQAPPEVLQVRTLRLVAPHKQAQKEQVKLKKQEGEKWRRKS
jgi:hypothetical protein